MRRLFILAGFSFILPVFASAQGRGMMAPVGHGFPAAPRAMAHVPVSSGVHVASGTRMVTRTATGLPRTTNVIIRTTPRPSNPQPVIFADDTLFDSDFTAVPGLGFDFVHLAATRGPGAVGLRHRVHFFPGFFPFFGSAFFLPVSPVVIEEASASEAQPESTESATPESSRGARAVQEAPASSTYYAESAAEREAEEFVFVRRDGTVFFAVAYSWENGALWYITKEGLRRTVARDVLDLGATQQFNEQRGVNFRVPA